MSIVLLCVYCCLT